MIHDQIGDRHVADEEDEAAVVVAAAWAVEVAATTPCQCLAVIVIAIVDSTIDLAAMTSRKTTVVESSMQAAEDHRIEAIRGRDNPRTTISHAALNLRIRMIIIISRQIMRTLSIEVRNTMFTS